MKILIVDDSTEKRAAIRAAVTEVPDTSELEISEAASIVDAKRHMQATRFDLLLLDIRLPARANEKPRENGGVALLQEVSTGGRYYKPSQTIGITAYDDARDQNIQEFAKFTSVIVKFDDATDGWRQAVRICIETQLAKSQIGLTEHDYDVAIVTALQAPELDAVTKWLPFQWHARVHPNDGTVYHQGVHESGRKVVAAAAFQMGMPAAATLAVKILQRYKPRYLMMAGIAAGVRAETNYGDVLVADPAFDMGSGKLKEDNGKKVFLPDPYPIRPDMTVTSLVKSIEQDVLDRIRNNWPGPKPISGIQIHVGPVASSAAVLAVKGGFDEVKSHWRKLIGLDLETYGVYCASYGSAAPKASVISMKAVTDFADPDKDDKWREYGAYVSAAVTGELIDRIIMSAKHLPS